MSLLCLRFLQVQLTVEIIDCWFQKTSILTWPLVWNILYANRTLSLGLTEKVLVIFEYILRMPWVIHGWHFLRGKVDHVFVVLQVLTLIQHHFLFLRLLLFQRAYPIHEIARRVVRGLIKAGWINFYFVNRNIVSSLHVWGVSLIRRVSLAKRRGHSLIHLTLQ